MAYGIDTRRTRDDMAYGIGVYGLVMTHGMPYGVGVYGLVTTHDIASTLGVRVCS